MNILKETLDKLKEVLGNDNVRLNEPMKAHTTMKVGGPAALFLTPEDEAAIRGTVQILEEEHIPYYILGNGSNVICRDEGYEGAIICLADRYKGFRITEDDGETANVAVKAGMDNKDFSDAMIKAGLAGFEFASGIPGSIGGATAMNAGAYDGELKNIVTQVKLLDRSGNIVTRTNEEMDFGYRHSLVSGGEYVVLETTFALKHDDGDDIQTRVDDLTERRASKQPLEYPSCGSTFKRPEGHFAGKLISDAGLKGYFLGGAQVSDKHAGFVINRDNASAEDVLNLIEHIKRTVQESQGVMLECEVKILG